MSKQSRRARGATACSSDPLMLDAFSFKNTFGLEPLSFVDKFATSADSFVALSAQMYHRVCRADWAFERFVSASAYHYYTTLHYWARVASIRRCTGRVTDEEDSLVRYVGSEPLHEPLSLYLRGLGNFKDPFSRAQYQHETLELPSEQAHDGIPGYFGKLDATTHTLYESYPSPGVAVRRIQADLRLTERREQQGTSSDPQTGLYLWDLPANLRPEPNGDQQPGLPTANLLGWAPAVKLSYEQRRMFEQSGISADGFKADCPMFALNIDLFMAVAGRVQRSRDSCKLGTPLDWFHNGSAAQLLTIQSDHKEGAGFDRTSLYCNEQVQVGSFQLNDPVLTTAAQIMGFRHEKRNESDGRRMWSCYDYGEYGHVPDSWNETKNSVYRHGDVEHINISRMLTGFQWKDSVRDRFLDKFKV